MNIGYKEMLPIDMIHFNMLNGDLHFVYPYYSFLVAFFHSFYGMEYIKIKIIYNLLLFERFGDIYIMNINFMHIFGKHLKYYKKR